MVLNDNLKQILASLSDKERLEAINLLNQKQNKQNNQNKQNKQNYQNENLIESKTEKNN